MEQLCVFDGVLASVTTGPGEGHIPLVGNDCSPYVADPIVRIVASK